MERRNRFVGNIYAVMGDQDVTMETRQIVRYTNFENAPIPTRRGSYLPHFVGLNM